MIELADDLLADLEPAREQLDYIINRRGPIGPASLWLIHQSIEACVKRIKAEVRPLGEKSPEKF